jgi:hypothetical protein
VSIQSEAGSAENRQPALASVVPPQGRHFTVERTGTLSPDALRNVMIPFHAHGRAPFSGRVERVMGIEPM